MATLKRAVLFVDEETEEEKSSKPLMLQDILFCPILSWLAQTLSEEGTEQFFVFCDPIYDRAVRACFLPDMKVTVSGSRSELYDFLAGDEPTLVIPAPSVPVDSMGQNYAYTASGTAIIQSLKENSDEVPGAEPAPDYTAIHTFKELHSMQFICRGKILKYHVANGVNVMDPNNTYIDPRVRIGKGTVVLPGTILRGNTVIGENCEIGPNAMIRDCVIGNETVVNASQLNESTVGNRTNIGPYAYVRPNCTIGDEIKVGDFVEVKNSVLGNGTKISHLTYVGDSDVGENVNFGCGTVTVNYDGKSKYRCKIGNHVFLGCNTNLIAPVSIEDGAYTAAGSTITATVPAGALSVARARQVNLNEWADKRRKDGKLK